MPGNEVGDRVHNFFGQDDLLQGQHHSQAVDRNWPGLSNNQWVGSHRQIGAPVNSSLKNYNVQQPDSDRGHGSQSLHVPHGLNFMQTNLRPEFGRVQPQNQQPTLNGYVHGHQIFQTRQNEANFLGVDTESDRQNLTSRGLSVLESQRGSGPEHTKNSVRVETSESSVGFDFFGGQQQMTGPHHPSMMQSLPRQQSGISDMQQLQRQVMFTQIQEFQRQHQRQQLERQQVLANQASSINNQAADNHSPAMTNGVPINEASNNQWPPHLVSGNTNLLQRGASPVMQGASSGHVLSPEQAHTLRLMGFVPQQSDQSLYGVPITSSSGSPGSYPHIQMDKSAMQQISASSNSFPGNQFAAFSDQVSMQDGSLVYIQDFHGRSMFGPTANEGLNSGFNLSNLNQGNPQKRNEPMEEFQGRSQLVGSSEQSQEKAVIQVTPSQSVATLDPTEEKILFGSDDNLWDAFGRSTNMGMGGSNVLDGTELFGGLSSLQSGTWSALMQSAVAETSSADVRIQEEWCPPGFRNQEPPTGNQQPSSAGDTGKQQSGWAGNNLHSSSDRNSRPSPHSADAHRPNTSISFSGVQGFQQSGSKTLHERGEAFQSDSSQRFIQQIPGQGSKWLDPSLLQKPPAAGSHNYGNISHSSGTEINTNSISGSWNRQQSISSHNSDGQPFNRLNGWNFIDSMSTEGGNNLKSQGNQILSQSASSGDHKRGVHEEMTNAAGVWKTDSVPNSNAEMEHAKYLTGSPQTNREGSSTNSIAKSNCSTPRANQESQSQRTNNHDFWKAVDSSVNSKGSEVMGKHQHHLDKNLLNLESSGNNFLDKGAVKMQDMENSNRKENSNDTFFSNANHHASDAGNSRGFPGSKQKSSSNAGQRPPGTRKFQYHPMGDVDVQVEPSYGKKHATLSQAMSQKVPRGFKSHDQVSFGQSKFIGHTDRSSMEMEKADTKHLDETPSKSMLPGFLPSTSTPFDRFSGNTAPNKAVQSSQHMLELLHKVDQPREGGNATHFSSSDHNTSSEMHEVETSEGSVGHIQRNQSSVSQGFGLQLAPPSQQIPIADHATSSQISSQSVFSSSAVHSEIGEKGHTWLASTAPVQPLPSSHETSQGEFRNNLSGSSGQIGNKASPYNIQGSFSSSFKSGFPVSRSQLENQHMSGASGQVTASQSVNIPFNRLGFRPKQVDDFCEKAQTSQSALPSVPDVSGSSSQNNLENIQTPQKINVSQGKESIANNFSEVSSSVATQRDIEAFGRSLRPNNCLHQNYSLLDQVQGMKSVEVDGNDRNVKRLKDPDSGVETQQVGPQGGSNLSYGYNNMVRDLSDHTSAPSGDSNMLSFSSKLGDTRNLNASSLDTFALSRKNSQNFSSSSNASSFRGEQSQVSSQMAPSWFDQYGTFKNGQMFPVHDTQRTTMKSVEPSFAGKPGDDLQTLESMVHASATNDASKHVTIPQSLVSVPNPSEQLPSPHVTHSDVIDESSIVVRPKKRKSATSELSPWLKELTKLSPRLLSISAAEADWARSTNRLFEKVEDESEIIEDGPPILRPKRRLILTTQLMQQLLRPPSAAILSSDASSCYESVAYFVSRLALGDACSASSCSGSDPQTQLPPDSVNLLPEKLKTPEKTGHQYLSKVVEDFADKARKLENDLLRLDKRTSILDLRVESQDLEKFSVINRFAKFHGRAQGDGAEASSSSDVPTNAQKSCPQKYVTALPVPRNLPDRVQCLSL